MNNLVKLFLFFLIAVVVVSYVITPSLAYLFDANPDNLKALHEESIKLGNDESFDLNTLQSRVIQGAKTIKTKLTDADYYYVYSQQICYNILCFLITALVFRKLYVKNRKLDWKKTNIALLFLTPLLLATSLPLISATLSLNEILKINQVLNYFGFDPDSNTVGNMIYSYAIIAPETKLQLVYSFLFIAIVPAVGEELFFRGGLQKVLVKRFGNIHNAIFFSALIFSAFHGDITAFFYRFFLGIILGYTFYWTKNLLIPIFIHAANNGITAFGMYYAFNATDIPDVDTIDLASQKTYAVIFSTIGTAAILWVYYFFYKAQSTDQSQPQQ
ncbi:MAG: membrane protease YdiL (CAAX protease family) [Glaciecola sp.]|jgi:membrane protease YdiL (CAAX protease family)